MILTKNSTENLMEKIILILSEIEEKSESPLKKIFFLLFNIYPILELGKDNSRYNYFEQNWLVAS